MQREIIWGSFKVIFLINYFSITDDFIGKEGDFLMEVA